MLSVDNSVWKIVQVWQQDPCGCGDAAVDFEMASLCIWILRMGKWKLTYSEIASGKMVLMQSWYFAIYVQINWFPWALLRNTNVSICNYQYTLLLNKMLLLHSLATEWPCGEPFLSALLLNIFVHNHCWTTQRAETVSWKLHLIFAVFIILLFFH